MAKIVCFKILNMFETIATKVFHDPMDSQAKPNFTELFHQLHINGLTWWLFHSG